MKITSYPAAAMPGQPEFTAYVLYADGIQIEGCYNLADIRRKQALLSQVLTQLAAAGLPQSLMQDLDDLHDLVGSLLDPYHEEVNAHNEALGNSDGEQDMEPWLPVLPELSLVVKKD